VSKPGFYRSYIAESVIPPYTLANFGLADGTATAANDGTKFLVGATQIVGADAIGDQVDICRDALPEVTYGGVVAKGDPLTSDANGFAIKAAPAPGAKMFIVGYAEVDGVAGDIGYYFASPDIVNG
jgi:hypothetical protein